MDVYEALNEAKAYLYESYTVPYATVKRSIESYRLHKQLHFLLRKAHLRLSNKIGSANIYPKDIHMLVEAWMMCQGTSFLNIGLVPNDYTGD